MGRFALSLVLCTALASSGCTAAGAAIGAGMPRYERIDWQREHVELGAWIRVHVRSIGADAARLAEIEGRYGGVHDGLFSLTDETGREREIPVGDVVDVETRRGTEWKKGLLIGAVADTVLIVTAAAIANGADVSVMTTR